MTSFTDMLVTEINDMILKAGGRVSTLPQYEDMRYPKFIPLMKFHTVSYTIRGFGSVMIMKTNAMGGMMKLLTMSFMPSGGKEIPYLLVDCMCMKKKNLAYVEYYDCTGKKLGFDSVDEICDNYATVPDYEEKPAWYVSERMKGSMIKGGEGVSSDDLRLMVLDSISNYLSLIRIVDSDKACLEGLAKFRDRMITEGNPSSGTMSKVLGEDGAKQFFMDCVMPM